MNKEEAMKILKDFHDKSALFSVRTALHTIIPELRESEDEKIRKELIKHLKDGAEGYMLAGSSEDYTRWLAWVEKQGEQKSADKVEPKFHEGDWAVFNNHHDLVFQVEKIENYEYTLRHFLGVSITLPFSHEDIIRAWTIQDVKDGDLLYSPCNKLLWIFKTKDTVHCGCNLNYNNGAFIGEGYIMMPTDAIPATKEQRNTLFAKMKEAGYEWDGKTHELKKISQRMVSAEAKEALYDKTGQEF